MRVADLVVCESCRISCGNTVFWVLQSYGKERVNKLLNINSIVKVGSFVTKVIKN